MTKDDVIVVTGGSSGLGAVLVKHFAARGNSVAMNYRNDASLATIRGELDTKNVSQQILPVKADVSDRSQVIGMFNAIIAKFGRVDILINCAGVNRDAPFTELTDVDWDDVVDSHLKGTFICGQEFVKRKVSGPGHVINLGAAGGFQGRLNGANFCSAKGGVAALTKCMARELAPQIQVNCMIPTAVDTREVRERYNLDTPAGMKKVIDGIPMSRLGNFEDVIQMTEAILCAKFTTGQNYFVNGGEYMH